MTKSTSRCWVVWVVPIGYLAWLNGTWEITGSVNAKKLPPLKFATQSEAEGAMEYYIAVCNDPFTAQVRSVKGEPTHRATNNGFQVIEPDQVLPLFSQNTLFS